MAASIMLLSAGVMWPQFRAAWAISRPSAWTFHVCVNANIILVYGVLCVRSWKDNRERGRSMMASAVDAAFCYAIATATVLIYLLLFFWPCFMAAGEQGVERYALLVLNIMWAPVAGMTLTRWCRD